MGHTILEKIRTFFNSSLSNNRKPAKNQASSEKNDKNELSTQLDKYFVFYDKAYVKAYVKKGIFNFLSRWWYKRQCRALKRSIDVCLKSFFLSPLGLDKDLKRKLHDFLNSNTRQNHTNFTTIFDAIASVQQLDSKSSAYTKKCQQLAADAQINHRLLNVHFKGNTNPIDVNERFMLLQAAHELCIYGQVTSKAKYKISKIKNNQDTAFPIKKVEQSVLPLFDIVTSNFLASQESLKVWSLDFDGCCSPYYHSYDKTKNEPLTLQEKEGNYSYLPDEIANNLVRFSEDTLVFSGSNRQFDSLEGKEVAKNKGASWPFFKNIAAINPFLLRDLPIASDHVALDPMKLDQNIQAKKSKYESFTKKVDNCFDLEGVFADRKSYLIYMQMWLAAIDNPGRAIDFNFFDDRTDILAEASLFFSLNPYMIPPNVTLHLKHYCHTYLSLQKNFECIRDLSAMDASTSEYFSGAQASFGLNHGEELSSCYKQHFNAGSIKAKEALLSNKVAYDFGEALTSKTTPLNIKDPDSIQTNLNDLSTKLCLEDKMKEMLENDKTCRANLKKLVLEIQKKFLNEVSNETENNHPTSNQSIKMYTDEKNNSKPSDAGMYAKNQEALTLNEVSTTNLPRSEEADPHSSFC